MSRSDSHSGKHQWRLDWESAINNQCNLLPVQPITTNIWCTSSKWLQSTRSSVLYDMMIACTCLMCACFLICRVYNAHSGVLEYCHFNERLWRFITYCARIVHTYALKDWTIEMHSTCSVMAYLLMHLIDSFNVIGHMNYSKLFFAAKLMQYFPCL